MGYPLPLHPPPVDPLDSLRALVAYHKSGGHEGDGSDDNLARCEEALSAIVKKDAV